MGVFGNDAGFPRSIVITGCGIWSAAGPGYGRFVEAAAARECHLSPWADRAGDGCEELRDLVAGLISDLSHFRAVFPSIKPPLPPAQSRIVMVAAQEALLHAGIRVPVEVEPVGAIFNRNRGPASIVAQAMLPVLRSGPKKMRPLLYTHTVSNAPLGALCAALGLRGANLLTMGGGAIQIAFDELRTGRTTTLVCGAMEEVEPYTFKASLENGYIGQATPSSPNGIATFGEGAAALVLETAAGAHQRGARPLAEVVAVEHGLDSCLSNAADSAGWGKISAQGLKEIWQAALDAAEVAPSEISYFCAGANGQPAHEAAQREAIEQLGLAEVAARCPSLHLLFGECYGVAPYLGYAWAVSQLTEHQRAGTKSNPGYALVTNTDFHAQHSAVVLKSVSA